MVWKTIQIPPLCYAKRGQGVSQLFFPLFISLHNLKATITTAALLFKLIIGTFGYANGYYILAKKH
jgi:hypothetical protein